MTLSKCFQIGLLFLLFTGTFSFGEEPELGPEPVRDEEFFIKELAQMNSQKQLLAEMAEREADAKKRFSMELAIKKADEVIQWRTEEHRAANKEKKAEFAQLGDQARNELRAMRKEIQENQQPQPPPPPPPTPTPVPATYETDSGFNIRLRFPE